ncbi:hypothetical protein FRC01_002519, partial [Tulasnella sp. 417]
MTEAYGLPLFLAASSADLTSATFSDIYGRYSLWSSTFVTPTSPTTHRYYVGIGSGSSGASRSQPPSAFGRDALKPSILLDVEAPRDDKWTIAGGGKTVPVTKYLRNVEDPEATKSSKYRGRAFVASDGQHYEWRYRDADEKDPGWTTTQEPKVDEAPLKIAVLPYEILVCQIVESLDDSSEACLLRTCRFFRNLVEPVLYRHIRVQHGPEEHNSSPLKPHLLHRTLVGRPDLLPAILSYHGPLIPNPRPSFPPERKEALWRKLMTTARQPAATSSVITEYLERATTIFSGTINMRELHFTDRLPLSIRAVLSVLDAPQLKMVNIKRLVLDTEWCWSRLPSVLRKQPGLKHLELPHMIRGGELELDETDFPELESLRAELRHAARIVPGRPVRKLDLQYTWRPNEDALWQRLTLST